MPDKKLLKKMAEDKMVFSMAEGRRMIINGAVKVNGEVVDDIDAEVSEDAKIQIGKKKEE